MSNDTKVFHAIIGDFSDELGAIYDRFGDELEVPTGEKYRKWTTPPPSFRSPTEDDDPSSWKWVDQKVDHPSMNNIAALRDRMMAFMSRLEESDSK